MVEGFDDKKVVKSEYNEAAFQIMRLHNLWQKCLYLRTDNDGCDYKVWQWTLDNLWSELVADAKGKDWKKYEREMRICNIRIAQSKKNTSKLYHALMAKEHTLRCLAEDVGKGSRKSRGFSEHM